MIIDTEGLRTFVAIVDAGSFSQAAQVLHLSQPAVSKRIETLEHSLGTRLLDRARRRVQLTPQGQLLLQRARPLLAELGLLAEGLAGDRDTVAGTLRFGASHHVGIHRLPPVLRAFHQRYPAVRLDLRFADSEGTCQAVRDGDLEFGVTTLPQAHPLLELDPIWADPLAVVIAREHPLASVSEVTVAHLSDLPALLPPAGSRTRKLILQGLGLRSLKESITSNHLDALKALAKAGLGWTVLPQTLVDQELHVLDLAKAQIFRTLGIVRRRQRTLSRPALALITLLRDLA